MLGGWEILLQEGDLSSDSENLRRNNFDHLNLFQSQKPHSVNIEHQSK